MPAYVDPDTIHRATTGAVAPAAYGDTVNDDLNALAHPLATARVYRAAAGIAIATATATAIIFDATRWNDGPMWAVGNPTRLTVPAGWGGRYSMGGGIAWPSPGVNSRALAIRLNGATYMIETFTVANASAGAQTEQCIHTEARLNAGDYIELVAFHTHGSNLTPYANPLIGPEFYASWQGA